MIGAKISYACDTDWYYHALLREKQSSSEENNFFITPHNFRKRSFFRIFKYKGENSADPYLSKRTQNSCMYALHYTEIIFLLSLHLHLLYKIFLAKQQP